MPLAISFELSDADLAHFAARMDEVRARASNTDETEILSAANRILSSVSPATQPEFVQRRLERLERMIRMLDDEEWKLGGEDRARIRGALAYVVEPHDMIADDVPGLGFVDDALMIELVTRDLRHELDAYVDFCAYRQREEERRGKSADPLTRERWLATRRAQLHERMRRRRSSLWEARLGRSS